MISSQQERLKNIIIVGGGSAGWMTAAALSSLLSPDTISVTLIKSDQIGTIGIGEATIPDMLNFNAMLGIEFIDWGCKGDSYFHPFGNIGVDMQGIDFHQYWLHDKANGNSAPLQNYSICAVAGAQNKFTMPDPNPRSVLSHHLSRLNTV